VTVQPKQVHSPSLISGRSRQATASVTSRVDRGPEGRGVGVPRPQPIPPLAVGLGTVPAPTPQSLGRERSPKDSVGILMFVFVAATLVMVAAVIAVGIVGRWWVLVPVMLVDFAITFGVVAYIMWLLGDNGDAPPTPQ
jgi:hypothetical protein